MRSTAYAVTILILASMLAGFSSATSSSPTQVVTSYSYSIVPISTITWTSTGQETLYSNSFPVAPAGGGLYSACNIIYDSFTGPAGQITGTVSTSYPVDFYLLSPTQFSTWTERNLVSCDGPGSYMVSAGVSSANDYNFKVDLPAAGQYYIIFFNPSSSLTDNLVVNIMSVGTAETYTMTSNSLYIQTILATQSLSQSSSQPQTNSPTLGQNGSILMFGILAIIVVVALSVIAMRKRRKTETPSISTKTPVIASGTMFCRKCGTKIPRDSTFCLECGEKITKA